MTRKRAMLKQERKANPLDQPEVARFLNFYDTIEARRELAWHFWWGNWSQRIKAAWKEFQDQKDARGLVENEPDWYTTGAKYLRLLAEGAEVLGRFGHPSQPKDDPPGGENRWGRKVDHALALALVYYLRKTKNGEWRPPVAGRLPDPSNDKEIDLARRQWEALEKRDFEPWFRDEVAAVVQSRWHLPRSFVDESLRSPIKRKEAAAWRNISADTEFHRDQFLKFISEHKRNPFAPYMGITGSQFFEEIKELLVILAMTKPGAILSDRFRPLGLVPSWPPRPV